MAIDQLDTLYMKNPLAEKNYNAKANFAIAGFAQQEGYNRLENHRPRSRELPPRLDWERFMRFENGSTKSSRNFGCGCMVMIAPVVLPRAALSFAQERSGQVDYFTSLSAKTSR